MTCFDLSVATDAPPPQVIVNVMVSDEGINPHMHPLFVSNMIQLYYPLAAVELGPVNEQLMYSLPSVTRQCINLTVPIDDVVLEAGQSLSGVFVVTITGDTPSQMGTLIITDAPVGMLLM
jgi:hypothetical protein